MSNEQEQLEKLIQKIQELVADETTPSTNGYLPEDREDVAAISMLCDDVLISSQGRNNSANMRALIDATGCSIYAGEQDSFGWLIGCVRTAKGVITYG